MSIEEENNNTDNNNDIIGSIDHILQITYKDLINDFTNRKLAKEAKKNYEILHEKYEIELKIKEENQKKIKPKKNTNIKDKKKNDMNINDISNENDLIEPIPDPIMYLKSAIDSIHLQDDLKILMQQNIEQIELLSSIEFNKANNLLNYLKTQHEIANLQEIEEEETLKRQGIFIGQHIPQPKSKLNINKDELSNYDKFSKNLLIANDLMNENKQQFLRKTGNMKISIEAEERENERNQHMLMKTMRSSIR